MIVNTIYNVIVYLDMQVCLHTLFGLIVIQQLAKEGPKNWRKSMLSPIQFVGGILSSVLSAQFVHQSP